MSKFQRNSKELLRIARILEEDPVLIDDWRTFVYHLDLKKSWIKQKELQLSQSSIGYYDLLLAALKDWTPSNGENATLENLREILKNMGRNALYQRLETKVPVTSQNEFNSSDLGESSQQEANSLINQLTTVEYSTSNQTLRFRTNGNRCVEYIRKRKLLSCLVGGVFVSIITLLLYNIFHSKTDDFEDTFSTSTLTEDSLTLSTMPSQSANMSQPNAHNSTTTDVVPQKRMWLTEWVSPFNSYCSYKYKIRPEVELVVDLEQIVLPDMVNLTAKCPERVTSQIIKGKVSSAMLIVLFTTFTNVTRSLTFTDNCDYVDSLDEQ